MRCQAFMESHGVVVPPLPAISAAERRAIEGSVLRLKAARLRSF
jgi:hypothetical protein